MSEEQPIFKVTDRRLFNADGSAREVPPEEKPEAPREVKPVEAPAVSPRPEPSVSASTAEPGDNKDTEVPLYSPLESQQSEGATEVDETELPDAEDPASFANFMMSIASNAASTLGMMEHPVTHKREVDLELGKHWIDILGMLQQKTRGNLLAQEQQILESLLADLRMQFVSLSNATPPKARKFSGSDITGAR